MKYIKKILKFSLLALIGVIMLIISILLVVNIVTKATNDRVWNLDQAVLPHSVVNNDLVTIYNIRNFTYRSTTDYTPNYYDKTFDLRKLKKVWYVVEPFSGIPGSAHTFLSFEFEGDSPETNTDNEFVSISVEIRKEKGEAFHPVKGLLNQYEIMYVIADEKDVVKLRSNYRKDLVYVYPAKATPEKVQTLFMNMLNRSNELNRDPEFYNTITNTCTTNIVSHINSVTPKKVPFYDLRVFFPENSDLLAHELGLIDTDLSFENMRKRYFINEKALKYADAEDFSLKIREEQ